MKLDVAQLFAAIDTGLNAYNQARNLLVELKDTLSSSDRAKVEAKLDELQRKNDELYELTIDKLRQAEKR